MSSRSTLRAIVAVAAWALIAAAGLAQRVSDAKLEQRTAADPAAVVAELGKEPTWLAWSVPGAARAADVCCFRRGWNERGCNLAGRDQGWGTSSDWPSVGLVSDLVVLAEIQDGRPRRLRAVGAACPIDGGGRRLVALDGVVPARSLDLLERWARDSQVDDAVREMALAAIAYHEPGEAARRLHRLSRDNAGAEERGQALFWLSQTNTPEAAVWIREAIENERTASAREQGVFALSQLDDGVLYLVQLLRETPHADVRRQALFWLAQSDDPRGLEEIERILAP